MQKLKICLFLACFLFQQVFAQDTHYWTNQFGTESVLMGGAVVGGTKDNSAIFYNPGSLGFIDTGSLSINATTYQVENIKIKNALGEKKDFVNNQFGSMPLLVSGLIKSNQKRLKIGYGLIRQIDFHFKANARIDQKVSLADENESPGEENFIGEARIDSRLTSDLLGIGMGYKLNDKLSIGLTHQFSFRSHSFSRNTLSRFFLNDSVFTLISSNYFRSANYFSLSYSAKFGIEWKEKKYSAGLTICTPSLGLYGSGDVSADITANNILYNGVRIDALANDYQQKLKARYKTPFSVSAGVNWYTGRSKIGISAQYYGAIKIYNIMQAKPASFVRPVSLYSNLSSDQFLLLKAATNPVFNVAIGYEYKINQKYLINLGFRTNNSFYNRDLNKQFGIVPEITGWDIYHFTLGGSIKKGRNNLTLGLITAFGSDTKHEQDGNLNKPSEENLLLGSLIVTKATYSSVGLLLGYTFLFNKH